jgi:restriction system protein
MVQAARSGRQNIAEGSQASGTSKKFELKLVGVARASFEELLLDYEDFLRQRGLTLWRKDDSMARSIRQLAYEKNRSYQTYRTNILLSSPTLPRYGTDLLPVQFADWFQMKVETGRMGS